MDANVSSIISQYVATTTWESISEAAKIQSKRTLINIIGCSFGGSNHPAVQITALASKKLNNDQTCRIFGTHKKVDIVSAATINAQSASAHAYDDTHFPTVAHPGAPAVSSALAYAEKNSVSGKKLLTAIHIANEIQCRLSLGLRSHFASSHVGIYMTGFTGPLGVAAGISKLIGLDEKGTTAALTIASMHASGLRSSHGNMCSSYVPGNAAGNGITAALLADSGMTGSSDPLGGSNGFFDVFSNHQTHLEILHDLGIQDECLNVAAKPYPSGVFTHAAIEAALKIQALYRIEYSEILKIDLHVNELTQKLTGKKFPKDAYEAQVSVYHWVASCFIFKRAGIQEASEEAIQDEKTISLQKKIEIHASKFIPAETASITVTSNNGNSYTLEISNCTGSPKNPISDEQLNQKFIDQTHSILKNGRNEAFLKVLWNIENEADVKNSIEYN